MREWHDIIRENRNKEFTYDMWENCKAIDTIKELSYDAAIHIAKTNSIVRRCTISCNENLGGILVLVFENGLLTNKYIGDKE